MFVPLHLLSRDKKTNKCDLGESTQDVLNRYKVGSLPITKIQPLPTLQYAEVDFFGTLGGLFAVS